MYEEHTGWKPPPAESRYTKDFVERYRVAQIARCARIDAVARRHITEASHGRAAMRAPDFAASNADNRNYTARRAMAPTYMIVYRTQANLNYLDLSIDPSERAAGSIISPRPDLANY